METYYRYYIAAYISLCILSLIFVMRRPDKYAFLSAKYFRFLMTRWKLATFGLSLLTMVFVAPYTGDRTWDYYDAAIMGVLTFLTAPWTVGVLFKMSRSIDVLLVAFCMAMFTASWSYDLYILFRDGYYPSTWLYNMPLSLSLYFVAGLLWNLCWTPETGVRLAFMEEGWPQQEYGMVSARMLLVISLFMGFGVFMVGLFVIND